MYGAFTFPQLPYGVFPSGVDLGNCVVVPTGGNSIFVRSTGPADYDPPALTGRIFPTLASALAQCRSGKADTIYVLPGHSESVTDATMMTGLVAGTRILGIGQGSNTPAFRWTATAAQWAITVADVVIQNLRLRLEGASGVVKAINVTGADFTMVGCDVEVTSGASNKATIAMEIGSGAVRATIAGNRFRGIASTTCIDVLKVVGATTPDDLAILSNDMLCATTGNGVVNITVAIARGVVKFNTLYDIASGSNASASIASGDGIFAFNSCGSNSDGTAASQGLVFAGGTWKCFQNFSSDESKKSGVLSPVAVST